MVAHSLIASDRVEGTPVVRAATGTKIGTIQRLMISKRSGFRLSATTHAPNEFRTPRRARPISMRGAVGRNKIIYLRVELMVPSHKDPDPEARAGPRN
jgi:hypothetical protein